MTHRLTRIELYDLVWSQPMQRLAKQFGISDVALAKACRRATIPVPKRGYWAKSQAGKKVTRIPLPPRGPGMSDDVFVGGRRHHWYEISDEELHNPIPQRRLSGRDRGDAQTSIEDDRENQSSEHNHSAAPADWTLAGRG